MSRIRCAAMLIAMGALTQFANGTISIRMSAFPDQMVADGRSGTNITLEVRTTDGRNVPDGTRILLTTTLGTFRETIVTTQNGIARGILIAGNIPGTAKITASEIGIATNPSTLEIELVASKDQLASSNDFVEIATTESLEFIYLARIATTSAKFQGVTANFFDLKLKASDLQYSFGNQWVKAKDVDITIGKKPYHFSEFYFDLRKRRGYGLGIVEFYPVDRITYGAGLFKFEMYDDLDGYQPTKLKKSLGILVVTPKAVKVSTEKVDPSVFQFQKVRAGQIAISDSELSTERESDLDTARILAKRMVVVSKREIQFQDVSLYQGEVKYASQRFFALNMYSQPGQTPTEQWVSVNNSQLAVNYPYYLSLEREQTKAIRLRTGQVFGRGVNGNRGVFFDYEINWNKNERQVSNFTYTGVGRSDYNLGFRQFTRFDDKTNLSFLLDSPQTRSILSSASVSRQEKDFQLSLTASAQRSLQGTKFTRQDYLAVAERNPIKLGKLPAQMFYGINMSYSQAIDSVTRTNSAGVGARLRFQSDAVQLKGGQTLFAGLTFSQLAGRNIPSQFATTASVSLGKQSSSGSNTTFTYDYAQDGFTEVALGRHRISSQLGYYRGNYDLSIFASKSIDVDRVSFFADASVRIASQWRIANQYTVNRFAGDIFTDFNWVLAYRMKPDRPEFGIVYTKDSKRLGFALLGIARN